MLSRSSAAMAAVVAAFLAAPALAQNATAPSPSPTPLPEIGRVQTTDRRDEPLRDVVKSTFVVTKAEMLRRGDATVADALERVPGVNVQRTGPLGTIADLTIDGYRTGQILVLIDGRPAGGEQIQFADIGTIPTTGVARIEVIEGGGATLYGTGALGGVVNIITDASAAGLRQRPRVMLGGDSLGGRTFAFENGMFAFERRVEPNRYAFPAIGPVAAGTTLNDDYSTTSGRVALGGKLGVLRVGVDAGLRANHLGTPGDAAFLPLASTARENSTAGDARVRVGYDRARSSTSLEVSGTTLTTLYTFAPNDPGFTAFTNAFGGTTQVSREGRVQASLRDVVRSDSSTLVAGIDLARGVARVDDGVTPATLGFAQTAAYAQESLTSRGGTRIDLGLRGERDGGYGGIVAPSLGVRVPLGTALRLRANYASGFRAPDITDLAYPVYSNRNLRPERSHGGDLALDAPDLLGGASLRWFVENGNDLIAPNPVYDFNAPTSAANPYLINVSRFAIAGFVGTIRTRPFHGFTSSLALTDTYRALDLTGVARRLPRRPVMAGDLGLEYASAHGGLDSAGILAHVVGAHDTPDTAYTRVDGYARFRASRNTLLSLRISNLGDERYADVSGFPMPGRTFAFEVSTR